MPYTAPLQALRTASPPGPIPATRWATFITDAERLVAERGAELHAAGWDDLDVFAIASSAPMVRVDGAGLAWMLGGKITRGITSEATEIVQAAGHGPWQGFVRDPHTSAPLG